MTPLSPNGTSQSHQALQHGQQIRLAAATERHRIRQLTPAEGHLQLADTLLDPCSPLGPCSIERALQTVNKIGRHRTAAILLRARVNPGRRVRDLTDRERQALADLLTTGHCQPLPTPPRSRPLHVTPTELEKAARALLWHRYQGCVSWEDTTDPETTGDPEIRGYALTHARVVLEAVGLTTIEKETDR